MKDRQRGDKTWTVFIRFTHKRNIKYISTSLCASKSDLTTSLKIKNADLLDKCNDIIKHLRKKLDSLYIDINPISIDEIVNYITTTSNAEERIEFVRFCHDWIEKNNSLKGIKNYRTALNAFCLFNGRDKIYCNEITISKMKDFELYLMDRPRAISLYTSSIHRMFNEAMLFYNNEEEDVIRVKNTLLRYKSPKQNVAEKRAFSIEVIRAIYELPYKGNFCRRDIAKDCFILSFCLMGINSADLYSVGLPKDDTIIYNRQKTRDRRYDSAKMCAKLHPIILPIIDRYKDNKRLLNFYRRYSNYKNFNHAINIGLKEIESELGITGLDYYSARHSMATIARNKVGIDKYTVNDMLCHTDSSMRVTDLYIEKDYKPMNEANFRLIDYVLGFKTSLEDRP